MATMAMMTINSGNHQRGLSLIEAMVATLVLAILFLGLAHVLARGLVSQRYVNTQNLALLEMRWNLQREDGVGLRAICADNESPADLTWLPENIEVTPSACGVPVEIEITVPGLSLDPVEVTIHPIPSLSTEANSGLFGGDGVITLSNQ